MKSSGNKVLTRMHLRRILDKKEEEKTVTTTPPLKILVTQAQMARILEMRTSMTSAKTGSEQHQERQTTRAVVTIRQPVGAAHSHHQSLRGPSLRGPSLRTPQQETKGISSY